MVGTEGANQSIDIEFYGVGAHVADCQEGVALPDVGEGGGHGAIMSRHRQTGNAGLGSRGGVVSNFNEACCQVGPGM